MSESGADQGSTIKEVAQRAGVSISTVSLVLNNRTNVRPETRERVQEAMDALGYIPRSAARMLVQGRTGNVGFVLRDEHFTRAEPFYTRVFLGAEFEADVVELYVLLATIPSPYDPSMHRPRFLRQKNIDGLLIAGKVDEAFLQDVQDLRIPAVLIDYVWGDFPCVTIDNHGGGMQAAQHLRERGHHRLAFVGADMTHPSLKARLDGFLQGVPADQAPQVFTAAAPPTRSTGQALGMELLHAEPRPTAVFCANDALAMGVMDSARQSGVRIPEDLAVLGFDDVEGAADTQPALTSIRVHKEQLGEVSLRALHDLIDTPPSRYPRGRSITSISVELIHRETT